ncbi:MAG: glycine cleavage system protein H [Desulfarculus sp.]|jgi:glycine cleavage system H lipoate-binding protein|nr:MAG: glycine cleavage system protein H [Desulfarculus sp.]
MTTNIRAKSKGGVPVIFDMTHQQCVWSQAGVAPPRLCHNAFDCLSCSFDKAMQRKKAYGWLAGGLDHPSGGVWTKERWQQTPAGERYCRHMLSGRVPFKMCIHLYNCANCAYDQMLDDEALAEPSGTVKLTAAGGFELPPSYYFHPGHTWARVEYGGRVRIGLDDLAARLFGPADEYRLPQLGMAVRCGGLELGFSRQGRQARAASPLEGVVVARNPEVLEQARRVNESPYDHGWLLLLEPARLQRDLKGLVTGQDSLGWMEHEAQRLGDLISADTGQRLAATGGRVVPDVYGAVPGLDWNRMVKEFLNP